MFQLGQKEPDSGFMPCHLQCVVTDLPIAHYYVNSFI